MESVPDGSTVFMFTEATGHAVLIMGREIVTGWTLPNYVQEFRKRAADNMLFDDGSLYDNGNGWQADGRMTKPELRVHIEIRRSGSSFWRIVAVQDRPYAYTDPTVATLREDLWATAW